MSEVTTYDTEQAIQADVDGKYISIERLHLFLTEIRVFVGNNLLTKETEVRGHLDSYSASNAVNTLPAILSDKLKGVGAKGATTANISEKLACIADAARFNPIENYLAGLKWDEQDRLPGIYATLGITEKRYQTYVRKWLIQCVALGLNDEDNPIAGEGVLVLLGSQGAGKTSFFRKLVPEPRWFAEGVSLDMANKDSLIRALGSWICELGELDATTKREQPALKAFITSPEDRICYPYAQAAIRSPRRTSFCGTVNGDDFLRDTTGSRRYWTVPVHNLKKEMIFKLTHASIDQLWAQVYQLYLEDKNGFRLTDDEMKQLQADNRNYEMLLPFEADIREQLDFNLPFDRWQWWTPSRLKRCGIIEISARDSTAVGRALTAITQDLERQGFKRVGERQLKRTVKGTCEYFIPLMSIVN